jgi:hypothetical protein
MLKRRRRQTCCRVEELEGRAAPSIVGISARIVSGKLEITATTFSPTVPKNRVVITFEFQYDLKGKVHHKSVEGTVESDPDGGIAQLGLIKVKIPVEGNHAWKNVQYLDPVTIDSLVPNTKTIKESSGPLIVRIT